MQLKRTLEMKPRPAPTASSELQLFLVLREPFLPMGILVGWLVKWTRGRTGRLRIFALFDLLLLELIQKEPEKADAVFYGVLCPCVVAHGVVFDHALSVFLQHAAFGFNSGRC